MSLPKRAAIIVGIDGYENAPSLRGCVPDAENMAVCLSMDHYDFDVQVLKNSEATRANILRKLGEAAYQERDGEMLVFYFAGHGAVVGNSGHLLTHDASQFDPGLALSQLSDLMESASRNFKTVVSILDCCHAGAAQLWTNSRPMFATDVEREVGVVNSSRSILGACMAQETAKEGGELPRGVFTEAVVQGLLGDAVNFDGEVTLLAVHEYVARAIDPTVQTPVFKGDVTGTVVLGSGFEPRKGAPIDSAEKRHILSRAQELMDGHYQMQNRELADREHRIHGGSRRCASELEDITRWFEETQAGLPDLIRDQHWSRLQETMLDAQRRLAEVVEGEETSLGVLSRRIGQGGFGQVWEVDAADGSKSALKLFHGGELFDQVKVARFRNGFQNMRKLQHPNIVSVHSMTLAPLAFSMEYVPGPDLRDVYVDRSDTGTIVRLMIDIAETLIHAHEHKVRHRDIKPENIIIVTDDEGALSPHLTDFDLAYHETNRTVTTNLGVGGVINYAAPEQLYEPNASAAREVTVDVYSLAQLMYFVIVGRDPSGENHLRNVQDLTHVISDWTDERAAKIIVDLYSSSTSRLPSQRPSDMHEVLQKLSLAYSYIHDTESTDKIAEDAFCSRVAFLYAGLGSFELNRETVNFKSKSGTLGLALRPRGYAHNGVVDLELKIVAEQRLSLQSISSSASARSALNSRLDKVTRRFAKTSRRNGKQGQYEVFIDLSGVALTAAGAATVRNLISEAISAVER